MRDDAGPAARHDGAARFEPGGRDPHPPDEARPAGVPPLAGRSTAGKDDRRICGAVGGLVRAVRGAFGS